ncbi:MAG: DUF1831 domain-containing protein [Aerococcus sp.]|nr:DUF1831 domain-containing protein [Aerococcus sp.]
MAFKATAAPKGSPVKYQVNEACKKFTLRDNNFVETAAHNYQYKYLVRPSFDDPRAIALIVKVNQTLDGLDISVTTEKGFKAIDVYNNEEFADFVQPLDYALAYLVEQKVLSPVTE